MNENEKTRPCPSCDGVMRRGELEETLSYQGHMLTYVQPGWHCDACVTVSWRMPTTRCMTPLCTS